MLSSVLIANRGEIACRIARTARRLGIRSIAVYSDADADALHVEQADEAVHIGPAPARQSYLDSARIIEAARRTGAVSVHPGYGFLSENAAFVDACEDAGLVFIGPPAAAMRAMGSKAAAKALMERSGVPLLPGYHGQAQDPDLLAAEAARIGFPVVVKAVAGGGGRGLRVVMQASGFAAALTSARQEAALAFGDDAVLVEKYLERPRHLEVQVFADMHGNAVHLFERDCSAQRRHQKVIEEAPAPGLDGKQREAMGQAAINAALAVGYVGAGTVEFVADRSGFYFLEMNTRLQVEHPVTEMVTGYDLVEWQFRVAAGERLPAVQNQIAVDGHAIEVRLYAEDPTRGFAPSTGRLAVFRTPGSGDGVRIDTGVREGDAISTHYDAMIAKLIVHGPSRDEALLKLRRALTDSEVVGVASNLDMLLRLATDTSFVSGAIDTGHIERHAGTLLAPHDVPGPAVLAAAALGVLQQEAEDAARTAALSADPHSPWHARDAWWPNVIPERLLAFEHATGRCPVRTVPDGSGWLLGIGDDRLRAIADRMADGRLGITLAGMRSSASVHRHGEDVIVRLAGQTWRLRLPDPTALPADSAEAERRLIAPIPGQVTQVLAEPGQAVGQGDLLVVLEAMKTVFRLGAPIAGVIAEVACRAGDMVEERQLLVNFVEESTPE